MGASCVMRCHTWCFLCHEVSYIVLHMFCGVIHGCIILSGKTLGLHTCRYLTHATLMTQMNTGKIQVNILVYRTFTHIHLSYMYKLPSQPSKKGRLLGYTPQLYHIIATEVT